MGNVKQLDNEPELSRLRSALKTLQILVGVLVCVMVGGIYLIRGQLSVHADSIPDVLTAKKFIIVDDAGNQRMVLGSTPLEPVAYHPVDYRPNAFGVSIFSPSASPLGQPQAPGHQLLFLGTAPSHINDLNNVLPNTGLIRMVSEDRASVAQLWVSPNSSQTHADGMSRLFLSQNGQESPPHDQYQGVSGLASFTVSGAHTFAGISDAYRNYNSGVNTSSSCSMGTDLNKAGTQSCH